MSLPPRTAVMSSAGARPMTASQTFFTTNALPSNLFQIPDGRFTFTIYTLIKQKRYEDVVKVLEHELKTRMASRGPLSLLAYCYFQMQNFEAAAEVYLSLVNAYPNEHKYKLYLAQCYYRCGMYDEAAEACLNIPKEDAQLSSEGFKLNLALRYENNDIAEAYKILTVNDKHDYDSLLNHGCLLFKEQKFTEAIKRWNEASQRYGSNPNIDYNLALGYYMDKEYAKALKHVTNVIEKGIKDYPDFAPKNHQNEHFVSNSNELHESRLVEAYNLRAAIEKHVSSGDDLAALDALNDMPQRREEDIDAITLHNMAVLGFKENISASMEKLNHLLQLPGAPAETLTNSLLLCISNGLYDSGADLLAHAGDFSSNIDANLFEFISGAINSPHTPSESAVKLDKLCKILSQNVILAMKQVQEAKELNNDRKIKEAIDLYDESTDLHMAAVLALGKIHWDRCDYVSVDKVLQQSMEYLVDKDEWKLAVANVLFVQEKYIEALAFFEPVVNANKEKLLSLPPIVLANTCVSYIMTNQNQLGEDLMQKIEQQEEISTLKTGNANHFHLCIVNLVIGVLYCSRGNFEFGISRIIASFDPVETKLSTETWFIAKTVFVSVANILSKQMIVFKDQLFTEVFSFLDDISKHGKQISAQLNALERVNLKTSVSAEARKLKLILLKLYYN